jgi:hypothetical protein
VLPASQGYGQQADSFIWMSGRADLVAEFDVCAWHVCIGGFLVCGLGDFEPGELAGSQADAKRLLRAAPADERLPDWQRHRRSREIDQVVKCQVAVAVPGWHQQAAGTAGRLSCPGQCLIDGLGPQ